MSDEPFHAVVCRAGRRPMDDLSRARLLAVEILLADPEALGNDALEADLYLLRDQPQTPTGT